AIWRAFARNRRNPKLQEGAVSLLARIRSPLATQRLVVLSLFGRTPRTCTAAVEELHRRDPRDFLELLISALHQPLRYWVEPAGLLVEGEQFNLLKVYGWGNGGLQSSDVRDLQAYNSRIPSINAPALAILRDVTGADAGNDRESWKAWWAEQRGYTYIP